MSWCNGLFVCVLNLNIQVNVPDYAQNTSSCTQEIPHQVTDSYICDEGSVLHASTSTFQWCLVPDILDSMQDTDQIYNFESLSLAFLLRVNVLTCLDLTQCNTKERAKFSLLMQAVAEAAGMACFKVSAPFHMYV